MPEARIFDGSDWQTITDEEHRNDTAAHSGGGGPILIADDHSTPLVFADLLQTEDGDDLLYADTW